MQKTEVRTLTWYKSKPHFPSRKKLTRRVERFGVPGFELDAVHLFCAKSSLIKNYLNSVKIENLDFFVNRSGPFDAEGLQKRAYGLGLTAMSQIKAEIHFEPRLAIAADALRGEVLDHAVETMPVDEVRNGLQQIIRIEDRGLVFPKRLRSANLLIEEAGIVAFRHDEFMLDL